MLSLTLPSWIPTLKLRTQPPRLKESTVLVSKKSTRKRRGEKFLVSEYLGSSSLIRIRIRIVDAPSLDF